MMTSQPYVLLHISVVLVTGGIGEGHGGWEHNLKSVELLNMDGSWNCPMPPLPKHRYGHTQTGLVACGGGNYAGTAKTCDTFKTGGDDWEESHKLDNHRYRHSAWASPKGIMLIGGIWGAGKKTEILREGGDSTPSFKPDHRVRYV